MKTRTFINIILIFIMTAGVALASEGGEHGGFNVMEWVWKVVNFGVLVFILMKFFLPMIKDSLQKRTELIEKTLAEAKQARELAEKALNEVNERLKNKDKELADILSASKASGEKEKENLILEGQKMSKRLAEQAKTNIEFELKQAREAIKAEAVELAMELAEKKMKAQLTPEEQKKLLDESLSRLEGSRN